MGKNERFPCNQRIISLLSALGKFFKNIIYHQLLTFVEDNSLTHFYSSLSDQNTTLFIKLREWRTWSNHIKRTKELYWNINVEKVFDSIRHKGIIFKHLKINIPLYLTKLVKSFLTKRQVCSWFSLQCISTRVPQDWILSPLLYSLYGSNFKISRGNNVIFFWWQCYNLSRKSF